jgi:hypothetical protein
MNLVTTDEWITWGQSEGSTDVPRQQIKDALAEIRRRLIGYVSREVIVAIEAANTLTGENLERYEAICLAQKLLTLAFLMPTINKIRNGGLVQTETDPDAQSRNQFERFSEDTVARIGVIEAMAMETLDPYISREKEEKQEIVTTLPYFYTSVRRYG